MSIQFDPARHTYTVDGRQLPSVTEICRFLQVDAAASAQSWRRDMAATRGTAVHECAMAIDYGERLEPPPDAAGYVLAYCRFLADCRPDWTGIETVLGSAELGFAGTCDRYGLFSGVPTVADLKTGAVLPAAYCAAQLAAYSRLLEMQTGFCAKRRIAIHLRRDGTYRLHDVTVGGDDLFAHCIALHRALNKKKGD